MTASAFIKDPPRPFKRPTLPLRGRVNLSRTTSKREDDATMVFRPILSAVGTSREGRRASVVSTEIRFKAPALDDSREA
jgi:hypothetical protein